MKKYTDLEKQFKEECTVININAEYPGNPFPVKWMIITGYTRVELEEKYSEILSVYTPYEIAAPSVKDAIDEYNRNEDKHKKRRMRNTSIFDLDEEVGAWCPTVPSFEEDFLERSEKDKLEKQIIDAVRAALDTLTETQKRRLLMYHIDKKSTREIARLEGGREHRGILESIKAAEKKFLKSIKNTYPNGIPLSKYSEGVIPMSGVIASSTSND